MDEYERGFEQAYKRREAEILNESKSHSMGLVQEGTSILGYSSYEREREEQILSESRDHVAVLGYN